MALVVLHLSPRFSFLFCFSLFLFFSFYFLHLRLVFGFFHLSNLSKKQYLAIVSATAAVEKSDRGYLRRSDVITISFFFFIFFYPVYSYLAINEAS